MKIVKIGLIILLVTLIAGLSYASTINTNITPANKAGADSMAAQRDAVNNKPGEKAERGVKNILFGWTDIPRSIIQVTRDSKNPFWGLTAGTLKGIGKAFPRTVSGVADVVSFPMGNYDKMPVKPDELDTKIQ